MKMLTTQNRKLMSGIITKSHIDMMTGKGIGFYYYGSTGQEQWHNL